MKKCLKKIVQSYLKSITIVALWRHKPEIVVIGGSVNKTLVKDYVLKFLREKHPHDSVRANPRSYNTEIGLPLAILYLPSGNSSFLRWLNILSRGTVRAFFGRKFPKKLVLELGVDAPGDMKYLLSIVKPEIAAVTAIIGSYSDSSATLDALFKEYEILAESLPENGILILNADDPRVKLLASSTKAQVILFGFDPKCDASVSGLRSGVHGQDFQFAWKGKRETVHIKKYGEHQIYAWVIAKLIKETM